MKDHVIICGLGKIGFRTFELLKQTKQKIVVISDKAHEEWRWQVEEAGGVFYLGDARNDKLLIKAGIKDAKAILALTNEDTVNVSIAMDARSLNPNIKIISRMHDTELGRHISKALNVQQIFSAAELAAPIFAHSIVEHSILGQFTLDKTTYLVSDRTDIPAENRHSLIANLAATSADKYKKNIKRTNLFFQKINYFRSPVFSHFRLFLFVLLCVILFSALFLKWAMPLSYVNALYFVTTTVTTVGYGDINFLHSPAPLKIFGCLLMLFGAASLAVLFSSITEIILSKKLPSILGGRPVPKKNHIVVVGSGDIGHQIVSILIEARIPVVIIEDDIKNRYSADITRRVALVEGYQKSKDTLKRANTERAKAILLITEDDIKNLSISLAAKKINPHILNVLQLFSSRLDSQLQKPLSLDKVFSVANIAAPYFVAAVFGEKILMALTWRDQLIFLSEDSGEIPGASQKSIKVDKKDKKTFHHLKLYSMPLTIPKGDNVLT